MLTRKTTTGYRVTVDFDVWNETFDFYSDALVCFKDVSRDYNLKNICREFTLKDWQIDYLLNLKTKEELMSEDEYIFLEDFDYLDELKNKYKVVGLSFGEHGTVYIGYGDDGVMLIDYGTDAKTYLDMLNSWFNGRIYQINVYEPQKFTSEDTDAELTYWEYVDGGTGYFSLEDVLDSLPDYAGEIIKNTETERFVEFERC